MTREFVPPKATLNVLGLRSSTIALRVSVTGSRSGNCRLEWPHRKGRLTTGSTTPTPQPAPTSWHLMQKNSISAATFQCAPHSENAASRIAASGSSHPCSPRSNTERSRQRARFDGSHDRRRSGDHDSCACHVAVCRSGRVSARRLFGSCAANVDLWQERAEAARILLTSSSHSRLSRSTRFGEYGSLAGPEAEKRADVAIASSQDAISKSRAVRSSLLSRSLPPCCW